MSCPAQSIPALRQEDTTAETSPISGYARTCMRLCFNHHNVFRVSNRQPRHQLTHSHYFLHCHPQTPLEPNVDFRSQVTSSSDPWAHDGSHVNGATRSRAPIMLLIPDRISNRKCPNIHFFFERVFVKVEFTTVLGGDASISSVIHQFAHRARAPPFQFLTVPPLVIGSGSASPSDHDHFFLVSGVHKQPGSLSRSALRPSGDTCLPV